MQIEPVNAIKPMNFRWVNWNLQNNAKTDRKYPKIPEGDYVRIKINPKRTAKGHEPTFSKEKYNIVAIKDNAYYIPSFHKHRMWLRHELLLV